MRLKRNILLFCVSVLAQYLIVSLTFHRTRRMHSYLLFFRLLSAGHICSLRYVGKLIFHSRLTLFAYQKPPRRSAKGRSTNAHIFSRRVRALHSCVYCDYFYWLCCGDCEPTPNCSTVSASGLKHTSDPLARHDKHFPFCLSDTLAITRHPTIGPWPLLKQSIKGSCCSSSDSQMAAALFETVSTALSARQEPLSICNHLTGQSSELFFYLAPYAFSPHTHKTRKNAKIMYF